MLARIIIILTYDRYKYKCKHIRTLLLHSHSKLHRAGARGTRGIQRNALACASSDRANKVSDVITFHVVRRACLLPLRAIRCKKSANGTMSRVSATRECDEQE